MSMEFTLAQRLDLKEQEIDLLKKALRDTVQDLNRAKEIISDFKTAVSVLETLCEWQNKRIKALESENLVLRKITRG